MKKVYTTPALNVFGSVETLTAIEGISRAGDVLINSSGAVIQRGNGSIDACTQVGGDCIAL